MSQFYESVWNRPQKSIDFETFVQVEKSVEKTEMKFVLVKWKDAFEVTTEISTCENGKLVL